MKNRLVLNLALGVALGACGPSGGDDDHACEGLIAGDLVISEIQADLAGDDGGKEWLELYNATGDVIDLAGLTVVHSKNDFTSEKTHDMTRDSVAAGEYFVIGAVLDELKPDHVDYGLGPGLGSTGLRNSDGLLALRCGATEVDSTAYASLEADASRALNGAAPPDYIANDDDANWCASVTSYLGNELGTPGAANDACGVAGVCNDGGTLRVPVAPTAGDLVITELMPDPAAAGDTDGEWFEVFVANAVDLNGLQIGRALDDLDTLDSADCLSFDAGGYLLFAKGSDLLINGGLPDVNFEFSFTLLQDDGAVVLAYADRLLDQATWTGSDSGVSISLDPDSTNATDNDDPAHWCPGVPPYGSGDRGTPGAANNECLQPGECFDGDTPRAIAPPIVGDLVITEFMANPSGVDPPSEWFEVFVANPVDLNGLQMVDGATIDALVSDDCLSFGAGSYVLFARNDDPAMNGGLPDVDFTFSFALNNSNSDLVLSFDAQVLDAITWTSTSDGASTQLDPDVYDEIANDTESNWCIAATAYGEGDLGTPAAANLQCL